MGGECVSTYAWNRVSGKGSRVLGTERVVGAVTALWVMGAR